MLLGGGWAFAPQQATDSPASSTLTAPDHPGLVSHEAIDYTAGNGVEERRTYDPRSRFLEGLSSQGGPAGLFQNLRFQHNPVGSILQVANDVAPPPGKPRRVQGPLSQAAAHDRRANGECDRSFPGRRQVGPLEELPLLRQKERGRRGARHGL